MKILIIAPVPPPLTGNSLPVLKLVNYLKSDYIVEIVNTSKKEHKAGISSLVRIFQIIKILWKVAVKQKKYDRIYLTVAESFSGNIRDIIIYYLCRKRLNSVYVHMFGGAAMHKILSPKNTIQFKLNKRYISELAGVFVEGKTQGNSFSNVISYENIYVVPNFAEDSLFVSNEQIELKFRENSPIRLLFLSNMLYGKGHIELLKAYLQLNENEKNQIHLDYVGNLIDKKDFFLENIRNCKNIKFHGPLFGDAKNTLFKNTHVFCLPTYYPYEGQPFSIIEAYASGNAVITTNHSGISNIFQNSVNGFEVEKKSVEDLTITLRRILEEKERLKEFAIYNLQMAKSKYTVNQFTNSVGEVLLKK